MARDHAVIRTDMWGDHHWRSLTPGAQWLYMYLLTSPSLTHVGVADWRPNRIAKLARGLTPAQVEKYAAELEHERFVIVDPETDEVMVRSFLRHDGVMLNPNLWKSVGAAFADIASADIIAAVALEAGRLREENPNGMATSRGGTVMPWNSTYLRTLLTAPTSTPVGSPTGTPSQTPTDTPSVNVPLRGVRSTPTPTPTTKASLPAEEGEAKLRAIRLPKDWAPTKPHLDYAKENRLDIIAEAEAFRLHAETHDRHAARWNAAFTTWLKKARPAVAPVEAPKKRQFVAGVYDDEDAA